MNVTLHLREDFSNDNLKYEKFDMHHFIKADVLVIGGTFSYIPAFFNLNTIYLTSIGKGYENSDTPNLNGYTLEISGHNFKGFELTHFDF